MYLKKLKLENFRNYIDQELELINGINLFLGDNAQGKTNIIESIYVCAFGKSYRTQKDSELINLNKPSRELLQSIIDKIIIDKDRNIEIFYKFSLLNNIWFIEVSSILTSYI